MSDSTSIESLPGPASESANNIKMQVNYGIEKFKFMEAVRVDDEVRLKVKVLSIKDLRGICKAEMKATLEIKDRKKAAYTGNIIFLYHFE